MSNIRRLGTLIAVLSLLTTVMALTASPASAQTIEVFRFDNVDTDDDWEVRITVRSFGGCGAAQGRDGGVSGWLSTDDQWAVVLDLNCTYTFTAVARDETNREGQICDAHMMWDEDDTPLRDELHTRDSVRGDTTDVLIKHKLNGRCDSALVATFRLDPEDVVESLPRSGADSDLEARAERAVEVTDFDVRVRADSSTKNRRGCDQTLAFTISGGDAGEVEKGLSGIPTGTSCTFRVTITDAPAPFEVIDADGKLIDTRDANADGKLNVDLSSLVRLPYARIAIIQDVTGSNNQGQASYTVTRACGGVYSLPPTIVGGGSPGIITLPGGQVVATLTEGRYTVHSPNFANFGPGAGYLAVARSLTSSTVEGCSVRVAITNLPQNCSVAQGATQSLTWRSSRQFENFDFEFDISCDGAPTVPSGPSDLPPPPPPTTPTTQAPSERPGVTAASADAEVRITARKVAGGGVEFGLQQQRDGSWAGRQLPTLRIFPADTRVGRWLVSSPLSVTATGSGGAAAADLKLRIVAQRLSSGYIEFGLQQQRGGSWAGRQLPTRRLFPSNAQVKEWLVSTPLSVTG